MVESSLIVESASMVEFSLMVESSLMVGSSLMSGPPLWSGFFFLYLLSLHSFFFLALPFSFETSQNINTDNLTLASTSRRRGVSIISGGPPDSPANEREDSGSTSTAPSQDHNSSGTLNTFFSISAFFFFSILPAFMIFLPIFPLLNTNCLAFLLIF